MVPMYRTILRLSVALKQMGGELQRNIKDKQGLPIWILLFGELRLQSNCFRYVKLVSV